MATEGNDETVEELEKLTFVPRLTAICKNTYHPSMRKAMQSVVLFEANRCLELRYQRLRPFQRKIALYETSVDLLASIDMIPAYLRAEVMFRTAKGKEPLAPDLCWRRMRLIEKDIKTTILPKIKPFLDDGKTQEEACEAFVQSHFESNEDKRIKESTERPDNYEHIHLSALLAYRMYYKGESVNPDLPTSHAPRVVDVPDKKPDHMRNYSTNTGGREAYTPQLRAETMAGVMDSAGGLISLPGQPTNDQRRSMLKEVKDHLAILKEFEGVISDEDLKKRKRDLYFALPPAPGTIMEKKPPASKRSKKAAAKKKDEEDDDVDASADDSKKAESDSPKGNAEAEL